jgi:tRNA1(Val) A37 N6-methylase TrmN6
MLEQPRDGFRVAIDTVLLAAAVPARGGQAVLDLGCGVGGAMLCVACRVPDVTGLGVEIQPQLFRLCEQNMRRNAFAAGLSVRLGDAAKLEADLRKKFDHVLMNPPYHEERRHDASPNGIKRVAHAEAEGELALWITSAIAALNDLGTLTVIHRAERGSELLELMREAFGEIEVLPLAPKKGVEPKRVIVRGRLGAGAGITHRAPLILHEDSGAFTPEAENILRHCKPLM